MKHHLWFKRKMYGLGWYPATWQGWMILLTFVLCVLWNFLRIDMASHSVSDTLTLFIPQTLVMVLVLSFICYETGEPLRWQWGKGK
jgi:hypothetical protein